MATLKKPKLLLLDEHTAALDPKTAAKVLETTEMIVNKKPSDYAYDHSQHERRHCPWKPFDHADGGQYYPGYPGRRKKEN